MTRSRYAYPVLTLSAVLASSLGACSAAEDPTDPNGSGGTNATAGTGSTTAGSSSGGSGTAGSGTAGSGTSGTGTSGSTTGGTAAAGSGAGGTGTAGSGAGGTGTAGSSSGGSSSGGSGGNMSGGSAGAGGNSNPGGADMSSGCGKAPMIASNMYNNGTPIPIMAANRQRRYILSVPTDYDNKKPYRLVIAWHQLDGNDKQMYQQNYYWLKDIPEAASSTIFVAPNGEKNGTPCTGNNPGEGGCGWPDSNGSNMALGDAVVAEVEANFCIDKKKIFANGWSYGGSMTYRTACSRPLGGMGEWGVRAIAIYNGAAQLSIGTCKPGSPVAFYASHGTNDTVLSYDGGIQMAQTYAQLNSCTWMTPTKASGNHVCTNVMGCKTGYPVEFCSYVGPHTPDPPREGGQRWQPQEVWKFFTQF